MAYMTWWFQQHLLGGSVNEERFLGSEESLLGLSHHILVQLVLSRIGSLWQKPLSMEGAIVFHVWEEAIDVEPRQEPVSVLVIDTVGVELHMNGQAMNLTRITWGNGGYAIRLNSRDTVFEWNVWWWQ